MKNVVLSALASEGRGSRHADRSSSSRMPQAPSSGQVYLNLVLGHMPIKSTRGHHRPAKLRRSKLQPPAGEGAPAAAAHAGRQALTHIKLLPRARLPGTARASRTGTSSRTTSSSTTRARAQALRLRVRQGAGLGAVLFPASARGASIARLSWRWARRTTPRPFDLRSVGRRSSASSCSAARSSAARRVRRARRGALRAVKKAPSSPCHHRTGAEVLTEICAVLGTPSVAQKAGTEAPGAPAPSALPRRPIPAASMTALFHAPGAGPPPGARGPAADHPPVRPQPAPLRAAGAHAPLLRRAAGPARASQPQRVP